MILIKLTVLGWFIFIILLKVIFPIIMNSFSMEESRNLLFDKYPPRLCIWAVSIAAIFIFNLIGTGYGLIYFLFLR